MASIQDERGYNQGFKPSPALTVRTERRVDYIINQFDLAQNPRILEIGCGTGEFAASIASKTKGEVTGIDLSEKFIQEAREHFSLPNLRFEVANFSRFRSDVQFDFVIGNGILHHLYQIMDTALESVLRLLRPGGKIVFLEPNILNPYCLLIFKIPIFRRLARLEPDEMAFSRRHIENLLTKLGFTAVRAEYRDFLLPNTPPALISPVIAVGAVAEKLPLVQSLSQSLFITARRAALTELQL